MTRITTLTCVPFFSTLFSLLFISGLGDDSTTADSGNGKTGTSKKSSSELKILIIFLGLAATAAFSVFLYKMWQRKKREEQHARLLKLFEQDDDLEVELGIRD